MFRHRSDRTAATLVGLALTAAACASTGDPGVEVQALQADVVFGVDLPEAEAPITAPTQRVPDTASDADSPFDDGAVVAPFRNTVPDRFRNVPFRSSADAKDCPTAPIGASPSEAAPEEVRSVPAEGLYSWKRDISVSQTVQGTKVEFGTTGFEKRIVRDVEVVGDSTDPTSDGQQFTYQTVRPDGFGQVFVESFRVNTDPVERGANSNVDTEGATQNAEETAQNAGIDAEIPDDAQEQVPNPNRVRVGEPNRGLLLTSQEMFDANGVAVGAFNPAPPVLLLPLPVEVGDRWVSTSTDPTTGQTMRVAGVVNERESVDACGTLLDGWRAELDLTIASGGGTVQRETELIVSTSLGAMVIGERTTENATDSSGQQATAEFDYGIAQTEPDPLPEDGGNP